MEKRNTGGDRKDNDGKHIRKEGQERRRWPWIVGAVVALLCLFVALLPSILSTGIGRAQVFNRVSRRLNGTVNADSWSISWFSGFGLDDLVVNGADGVSVFQARSVTVDASVPMLLGSSKDLGTVTVESPRITVVRGRDGSWNLAQLLPRGPARTKKGPLSIDVSGDIRMTDGTITIRQPGAPDMTLETVELRASIDSLNRPIEFSIEGRVTRTGGRVKAEGTVTPMQDGRFRPDAVKASLNAVVEKLELEPAGALLPEGQLLRPVGGTANLSLDAEVSGMDNITAEGEASASSLALAGGLLRGDRPTLQNAGLDFKMAVQAGRVRVDRLRMQSPVVEASFSGLLPVSTAGRFTGGDMECSASVDLAALGQMAPSLLRLRPDLKLTGGRGQLSANIALADETADIRADAELTGLTAERQGESLSLTEPLTMSLKASLGEDETPVLERLHLGSSFVTLNGSGTPQELTLEVESDLAAVIAEAQKFIDVGGAELAGNASLALNVSRTEDGQRIEAEGHLADLRLAGLTPSPVTEKELTLQVSALVVPGGHRVPQAAEDLKLTVDSTSANLAMAASRIAPGGPLPTVSDLELRTRSELAELTRHLNAFGIAQGAPEVEGRMTCTLQGGLESGVLTLRNAKTEVSDLAVRRGDTAFSREKLTVSATGELNLKNRSGTFSTVNFQSGRMNASASDLSLPPLEQLPAGLTGSFSADLELGDLMKAARPFVPLPQGKLVEGHAEIAGDITGGKETHEAQLELTASDLRVSGEGDTDFTEDNIQCAADLRATPDQEVLEFGPATVTSSPGLVQLDASGTFRDWSGARVLEAKGTLRPDLARVASLVRSWTGKRVTLEGTHAGQFDLKTGLRDMDPANVLKNTTGSAQLRAGRAGMGDIEATDVALRLDAADGEARCRVIGQVNGGELDAAPILRAEDGELFAVIPERQQVLTDARLESGGLTRLLSRGLPIFRGALRPQGRVSASVEQARVPLRAGGLQLASLGSGIQLRDVSLNSSGILRSLLQIADLQDKRLKLSDQDLSVSLKDGIVHHDTLNVAAGDYDLELSGSVGLDKSLNMKVELPVTRALAGSDMAFALLRGRRLTARIEGTLDDPRLQRDILRENLKVLTPALPLDLFRK